VLLVSLAGGFELDCDTFAGGFCGSVMAGVTLKEVAVAEGGSAVSSGAIDNDFRRGGSGGGVSNLDIL
jgi:NADPH-dependent 2,4-dienoyl-CoA reductase/sulfur reductase-like enzyme